MQDAAGRTDRSRILVVGDVIDDVVVRPRGPVRSDTDTTSDIAVRPGGSGANTAAWLGSLGLDVTFVGTVHAADLDRHRAALETAGVIPALSGSDSPTGAIVLLADGAGRTMFTSRGANVDTGPAAVTDALLEGAAHLHLSGYSVFAAPDGWTALIRRAQSAGAGVSVDLASAGYLADFGPARFLEIVAEADLVFANREEARVATGTGNVDEAAGVLDFPVVVIKLGKDGAVARQAGSTIRVPAVPVDAIDATGAGDAFDAGFLAAQIAGMPLETALRHAVATAARAVVTVGGRPT